MRLANKARNHGKSGVTAWRARKCRLKQTSTTDRSRARPKFSPPKRVRVKTAESVRQAKSTLFKSLATFFSLACATAACATAPFLAGMPLNRLFRPWGQLLILGCTLAVASSAFAVLCFASVRSYKRALEKMLGSDPETHPKK